MKQPLHLQGPEPRFELAVDGEEWVCVPDFEGSGPDDRHYTLDAQSGEIRFGDGVHGKIPPAGSEIRARYRCGGGVAGDVKSRPTVTLRWEVGDLRTERVLCLFARLRPKGVGLRTIDRLEDADGGWLGTRLLRTVSMWLLRIAFRFSRFCSRSTTLDG